MAGVDRERREDRKDVAAIPRFGLGALLVTLTEFAFFLSTIEYSQLRPMPGQGGAMLLPPGFSRPKQVVFTWIYYFFQTMGRGLFPLLVYFGMVGLTWGRPDQRAAPKTERRAAPAAPARNAACPCGSGKRYKRCCGAS